MDTNGNRSETPASGLSHVSSGESTSEGPDQTGGQKISVDSRSTHWDAILNEIGAMKDAWSEENDKIEFSNGPVPTRKPFRPSLVSGLSQPPDRATIMESLPSREAADRLVAHFFKSYTPSVPATFLVHEATFLKQCNKHWENPAETKIMWIGLLFGAMGHAMQSYIRTGDIPPEYQGTLPAMVDQYRICAAQCIVLADITKPAEFTVETMMFYAMLEYTDSRDGDIGICLLSGTIMRLALQQGYHRDPSQHPNLTPFQGEMRRRVWTGLNQHEVLFSVLIGLPKPVKYAECDTQPPRNIHEEELYEDMKELPPSRPLTKPTVVCYQVVKARMMRAYGEVVEFLHLIQPQPFAEVMRLDLNLMKTREMIPAHLQLGDTLEDMKDDQPATIMEKYILQLFYHKAIVLLHRKFWDAAPEGTLRGKFYYSRKTCVASAVALLDHQALMHEGIRPGGPLVKMKWYHFVITTHDFLLAAMVICLDVMNLRRHFPDSNFPPCVITEPQKLNAILRSRNIWADIVDDCRDAKRAVTLLDAVLSKLKIKGQREEKRTEQIYQAQPLPALATNPTAESLRFDPYFTDQFALGGMPLPVEFPVTEDAIMQDTFPDILSSDLSVPNDFNWDVLDQFLQVPQQPFTEEIPYEFQMQSI
ncbi:Equisetin cluster transcription factor eqxF [Lachnellula arida]|uniref:Equisetin cluster transcription factor eqxF n=1 Tax=Lachnellula arida TaxID=1316785 RepID=A0A8T9B4K9_9HELO|nr:Equisetin cluster transcription factor eqxF [Lachnellula arida]